MSALLEVVIASILLGVSPEPFATAGPIGIFDVGKVWCGKLVNPIRGLAIDEEQRLHDEFHAYREQSHQSLQALEKELPRAEYAKLKSIADQAFSLKLTEYHHKLAHVRQERLKSRGEHLRDYERNLQNSIDIVSRRHGLSIIVKPGYVLLGAPDISHEVAEEMRKSTTPCP